MRGRVLAPLEEQVSIHEEKGLYTLRNNRWSLYAWLDAAKRSGTKIPRTLVHFGAQSIFGPSSTSLPSLEKGAPDSTIASSIEELSDDAFAFAAMAAGWVDTVYWVQPDISCYSGPMTPASCNLEMRNGRIAPARADSSDYDPLETRRLAFSGEPLSRLFPIEVANEIPTKDWEKGRNQIYCLSRGQLRELVEAASSFGPVWVDVDLGYFGSALPIEKGGYLALSDESDFGVGMLGPGAPVFRHPPDSVRADAAAVAELMSLLAPEAVTIVESPARSQRGTLAEVESILRAGWLGEPASMPRALIPSVSIGTGPLRTELQSECATLVDVANQDSLRFAVRWPSTPPERMEISIFFGRGTEPDRLIARWRTIADRPSVEVAVRLASSDVILEPGWMVEVRRLRDGALAFAGAFALDRGGARLVRLVREQKERDPTFPGVETLRKQSPPELIVWGMRSQVPVTLLHEILLAHPATLRNQCDDLRAHWISRTPARGD